MISIELMGGLGNQLFQIFAAIGYSFRYDTPFFFDDKKISIGWRTVQYWDTLLSSLRPYLKSTPVYLIYRDPHFHYAEIPLLGKNDDVKLLGYFQSFKHFDNYKTEIFELIDLKKKKENLSRKFLIDSKNTISMHFRIGDYKKLQEHHPILPLQYYAKALKNICEKSGKLDWNVLYACEEEDNILVTEMIIELQKIFSTAHFEKLDESLADWEQLLAMSICRHNIIANSTFSWFSAYFNSNPDKIVHYPSVWFGSAQDGKNVKDLFPNEWKKIIVYD